MKFIISSLISLLLILGCSGGADIEEVGQQVGDAMASIDEAGGNSGVLSLWNSESRSLQRLDKPSWLESLPFSFFPNAQAATCTSTTTFGSCSSNTITRTFGSCTIGSAILSGTVALTWGGTSSGCTLIAFGDTITRVPNFTLLGRRSATLTSTKTGTIGQRITWSSGTGNNKVFAFSNDGIRRVFTSSAGTITYDYTTQTTSDIAITGTLRSNRVLSGGSLRVTNNLTSITCDYVPNSVTWSSTCSCATSGSWSGSCSDGKSSTLTLSGCGIASFTLGGEAQNVIFDRCYGV